MRANDIPLVIVLMAMGTILLGGWALFEIIDAGRTAARGEWLAFWGNVLAGVFTLAAAAAAWFTVRGQIRAEHDRDIQARLLAEQEKIAAQQAAKHTACMAIAHAVQVFGVVNKNIEIVSTNKFTPLKAGPWIKLRSSIAVADSVASTVLLDDVLRSLIMRLAADDANLLIAIRATMLTFLDISNHPANKDPFLIVRHQRQGLSKLPSLLERFNADLYDVYVYKEEAAEFTEGNLG
jgi:hypothetical protein